MPYQTGRGIGEVFEKVVNAREAYVVSPWISGKYAIELARAVREGRAFVVTSLDSELLRHIAIPRSGLTGILTIMIGVFMITISIAGLAISILTLILAPVGVWLIVVGYRMLKESSKRPGWIGRVRVSPRMGEDGFIHIKLYIADGEAWIGSANMTPSAIYNNVEVLVQIPRELALEIFNYAWSRASPY